MPHVAASACLTAVRAWAVGLVRAPPVEVALARVPVEPSRSPALGDIWQIGLCLAALGMSVALMLEHKRARPRYKGKGLGRSARESAVRTPRERFLDGFGVVFFVGVGIVALDIVVAITAGLLSLVV